MKPTLADSEALRLGALLTAIGAAGVVVASAFYAASPHAIALPEPLDLAAARAGAIEGAFTLQAAGSVGVVADVVLVAGTLVVAAALFRQRVNEALGWIGLALATGIFVGVDSVAGFVLVPLAKDGGAAFEGFKRLFDGLFLLGAATFGAATWLAAPIADRALSTSLRAVGVLAVTAAATCSLGAPLGRAVGIAIAAGSALFVVVGVTLRRAPGRSDSASSSVAAASLPTP